jgi:hypothetical protein
MRVIGCAALKPRRPGRRLGFSASLLQVPCRPPQQDGALFGDNLGPSFLHASESTHSYCCLYTTPERLLEQSVSFQVISGERLFLESCLICFGCATVYVPRHSISHSDHLVGDYSSVPEKGPSPKGVPVRKRVPGDAEAGYLSRLHNDVGTCPYSRLLGNLTECRLFGHLDERPVNMLTFEE